MKSTTFLAFGNNTVKNIIESPFFTFKKIVLREDYEKDRKLISSIEEKKINYEILNREDFSRYNIDKKCQGIVAFIKEYRYLSLRSLLLIKSKREYPIIVMLDSIEDPQNFGSILRTLAAFEIDGVIIAKKNQVPVNNTVVKVSTGGIAYVPISQVDSLDEAINELKKKEYKIISAVCESDSEKLDKFDSKSPICLIFGNEHQGIKKSLIKKSDYSLYIPIKSEMDSLNVSVSCGIFCAKIISIFD